MNWPRAIGNELQIVFRMTFVEPIQSRRRRDAGWIKDRHLRTGFILGLPVFIAAVFIHIRLLGGNAQGFLVLFSGALVAKLIWLSYSAWSRARSRDIDAT